MPVNLPNSITLARILVAPLFLWALSSSALAAPGEHELVAAALFLLASASDGVDGIVARRRHQVTALGMLLSPLADKILLSTAYVSLVHFAPALMPAWAAFLLVGREFLITGLASVALQEKMQLRVHEIGKLKTVAQLATVAAVLLAHAWPHWRLGTITASLLAETMIYLMLVISLFPAVVYFRSFWNEAREAGRRAKLAS